MRSQWVSNCHTRAQLTIPDYLINHLRLSAKVTCGTIFYLVRPAGQLFSHPQEWFNKLKQKLLVVSQTPNFCRANNFFDPKFYFSALIFLGPKNFWGPKFFSGPTIFSGSTFFLNPKVFSESKFFSGSKFFGLGAEKFFWTKHFFPTPDYLSD